MKGKKKGAGLADYIGKKFGLSSGETGIVNEALKPENRSQMLGAWGEFNKREDEDAAIRRREANTLPTAAEIEAGNVSPQQMAEIQAVMKSMGITELPSGGRRKTKKLRRKFDKCVKAVRKTVKARRGSTKKQAAYAICTASILKGRVRT